MDNKSSEPLRSQTPERDHWRKSLRSPSHSEEKSSSYINRFAKNLKAQTASPSPKSTVEPLKWTKKRIAIANALKNSTKSLSGTLSKSADVVAYIEAEYIKALQRQIYFLELETNYLREQARKATEIHPQMMREADHMLDKLREIKTEMDRLNVELKQRDSHIQVIISEKGRFEELIMLETENHRKEKTLFTEELVTMKKEIDRLKREVMHKNDRMQDIKNELDKAAVDMNAAEMKIKSLKVQLEQRIEQHSITQLALEEKRAQLLLTEAQLQETEEKYISNTVTVKDKLHEDLRDEIRLLHQKLKEAELEVEKDRFLTDKMSDDIARIIKENSSLNQQLVELRKQLEREKELRHSASQHYSKSMAEVATLKERLKENDIIKHQLKQEQEKSRQYLEELKNEEATTKEYQQQIYAVKLQLSELERLQSLADSENSQLRKEKFILVDNVAGLHQKMDDKNKELLSKMSSAEDVETRLRNVDLQKSL